ncbi:leucine-rich repeat domain-containing protein [Bradyrhizobium sp. CCBAU 53415]|uniref:leucine-rich repeat domain-containing protein n=1 Tax=Bradyrhizobium sp. CCBAU 53415 TaxID=1325119 RepID=UPI003FA48DC7
MPDEAYQVARRRIINNAKRRKQESLDLSGKGLKALPAEIGQLTSLKKLDLSGNQLTTLPSEINLLTNLEDLNLSDNAITSLPDGFWQLPMLIALRLNGNGLGGLACKTCWPYSQLFGRSRRNDLP